MELFAFGMVPILGYLEARLQGILINSIPAVGPLEQLLAQPSTRPEPPPALPGLPGLPALPPQPPARPLPRRGQQTQVLPGIETRYVLYDFCDDLKPAITSAYL